MRFAFLYGDHWLRILSYSSPAHYVLCEKETALLTMRRHTVVVDLSCVQREIRTRLDIHICTLHT